MRLGQLKGIWTISHSFWWSRNTTFIKVYAQRYTIFKKMKNFVLKLYDYLCNIREKRFQILGELSIVNETFNFFAVSEFYGK